MPGSVYSRRKKTLRYHSCCHCVQKKVFSTNRAHHFGANSRRCVHALIQHRHSVLHNFTHRNSGTSYYWLDTLVAKKFLWKEKCGVMGTNLYVFTSDIRAMRWFSITRLSLQLWLEMLIWQEYNLRSVPHTYTVLVTEFFSADCATNF